MGGLTKTFGPVRDRTVREDNEEREEGGREVSWVAMDMER